MRPGKDGKTKDAVDALQGLFDGLADHVYVTDYQGNFEGSDAPSRSWYCGGGVDSPDTDGVRRLGSTDADIGFAEFICTPDDPRKDSAPDYRSTAGIIYLTTGVCFNIANRILVAGNSFSEEPLLVDKAAGYDLMLVFLGYGSYGTDEPQWRDRIAQYTVKKNALSPKTEIDAARPTRE